MTPFIGQLLLASWSYATTGFLACNGQALPINQYQALFSLLGTSFGGNGTTTFQLPNLQGRTPVGVGNGINWGQTGGEETHTLNANEVPAHNHVLSAAANSNLTSPTGNLPGSAGVVAYTALTNTAPMHAGTLSTVGASQPHENRQPYLVMNWLIALTGIFPSRN
jgi:microcystin-dependent protein